MSNFRATYLPTKPANRRQSPYLRVSFWLVVLAGCAIVHGDWTQSQSVFAEETLPAASVEFFEKSVRPVLVKHCYECHSTEEANGGLVLDSREGVLKGGDTGPAIVPGDPDKSLLIEAIRYKNRDLQMPPQNAMSAAEIAALEKWVKLGAPDPRLPKADAGSTKPTGMSIADGREFWSFKPVSDPAPPQVAHEDWVRTPIDAFILAKLEEQGLQPAPRADKRTLIRRVTFDLTGLPPTPQEVQNFLADETENAFTKVVERLLDSPQYGVRWGRHWLDVVRYADSNGLDENLAFGNAWRYRDYVVNAFNNDKPFDRFLIEQIAGDLMPGANHESKIATAFLLLGAKVLAEPDMEKLLMDTIDEQLDSTGKAFMAMTVGCVRCHDHKFDPLKQTDYYALAAIFKSTQTFAETRTGAIKHWNEYTFGTEAELAALKKVDAEIKAKQQAAASFKGKAMASLKTDARSKAADYLAAATRFDPDMPLTEVSVIAKPLGLHPRILHHCRLHLKYQRDDPFFSKWHELVADVDADAAAKAVKDYFGPLFEEAETAWAAARKQDAKLKALPDERLEMARSALNDASGFLAVPPKPEFAFDEETLAEYYRLMDKARIVESNAPDVPAAMSVTDGTILTSLPIHIRGSHRNFGAPVSREFPEVMRTSSVRPIFPKNQSGRLQLAQWLASTQHPLTARVFVNRIWHWHFNGGIVRSTDNFGRLGDRPSHPQLLDWLARRFMQSGWSTKELQRLILASSVYQMAAVHPSEQTSASAQQTAVSANTDAADSPAATDPAGVDHENRLLWKFRLQRLEAEQIRDAILAASGRLDDSLGGKTIPLRNRQFVFNHTSVDHTKYDSLRRAIYLPVVRNNLYTLFEQFDFPDPTMPSGTRNSTVVAPQALLLMNSPLVMDSADEFAKLLLAQGVDDNHRINLAYERTLSRLPTAAESSRALAFIGELTSHALTGSASVDPIEQQRAWSLVCQSLYACNEFIYVR